MRKGAWNMSEKRRDQRNRILRNGESQRKDGRNIGILTVSRNLYIAGG